MKVPHSENSKLSATYCQRHISIPGASLLKSLSFSSSSVSPSPNHLLSIFLLQSIEQTPIHTNTPILITAILVVQEVEVIAFFLVISITLLLCQRSASTKIIPIYPTGCLHKRFRLSDLLRGMTDSSFPLVKENWIHQPLLNGCIQAFDYTPSNTLVGVCGVFNCVLAHMYA